MNWHALVLYSLQQGLSGLENLALIPGTVGACPIQNIGAYGAQVGDFIHVVEAFDRHHQQFVRLDAAACALGYRDSVFKQQPERYLIVAVEFNLHCCANCGWTTLASARNWQAWAPNWHVRPTWRRR